MVYSRFIKINYPSPKNNIKVFGIGVTLPSEEGE